MEEPPSYHSVQAFNQSDLEVDLESIVRSVQACLKHCQSPPSDVRILVASDQEVARLNSVYRHVEGPTDVLTFADENPCSGDIAIAAPFAKRQSALRGVPFQDELSFLAIHGALHLNGMDDESEEERREMTRQMALVAAKLAIPLEEEWASLLHEGGDH